MEKAVNTIVLDAGPIIKNDPSVSSLLSKAENLVTTPDIISEIKDADTKARITSTLIPFLTLRNPTPESLAFAKDFARRTGDLSVLSRPDLRLIALAYELECERNGGDWRLRKVPGQKRTNGPPPARVREEKEDGVGGNSMREDCQVVQTSDIEEKKSESVCATVDNARCGKGVAANDGNPDQIASEAVGTLVANNFNFGNGCNRESNERTSPLASSNEQEDLASVTKPMAHLEINEVKEDALDATLNTEQTLQSSDNLSDTDADSDGWITPSNLEKKKKQQQMSNASSSTSSKEKTPIQVATITTDFSMQNVLLQMNLNLFSPSLQRVKHLKIFVLRCHACFNIMKDMSKQFCSRCGQPSLTRVSSSTTQNGGSKLHLKKNMQWNTRGDRYSIPKPVPGSANGRINNGGRGKTGGKGGWGQNLILAEDQKEYVRAVHQNNRKERDLMDDDFLPSILSGERTRPGGRPKVGAGRNVNSRKRH